MPRWKRVVFELFGPPMIGAMLLLVYLTVMAMAAKQAGGGGLWASPTQFLETAGMVLVIAYVFAGIQSVIYTVIVEWRFRKGLNPASWRAVGWSSFLGFCSGATIIIVDSRGSSLAQIIQGIIFMGSFGAIVGFLVGWLTKVWSRNMVGVRDEPPPAT